MGTTCCDRSRVIFRRRGEWGGSGGKLWEWYHQRLSIVSICLYIYIYILWGGGLYMGWVV